jgi:serine protease inhibitor
MLSKSKIIVLAAILLASLGCSPEQDCCEPPPVLRPSGNPAKMNQLLGWKIFNEEHRAKLGKNILISPFSIQTALFMANNGANGNTLQQLLNAMNCENCDINGLNAGYQQLSNIMTRQSGHPRLTLANRFFYDNKRIVPNQNFINTVSSMYNCGADNLNFDAPTTALGQINSWVKNNTNDKIDKILDQISPLDVAFLINALHFKGDWAKGFSTEMTHKGDFTTANGAKVQVNFVSDDRNFSFVQNTNGFNLVDIPFRDSMYSLSLIQPSTSNTDPNWHNSITTDSWLKMYEGMRYTRAIVSFPRLKLAFDTDLIPTLKNMGITDAFSETAADFKNLGNAPGGKNIFIKQVRHKAVLEVDEKGAEGAAVTSIGFGVTSLPPIFRFDKPFVLVLRNIPNNTLIFVGFVADPVF